MSGAKLDHDEREQRILDVAADLIMGQGYDKTTMGDVADRMGVSRGIIYLHFEGKEALFEAIIRREMRQYSQAWLDHIEADPRGGTVGGLYRAVLYAINNRPFMAALMRRDRRVFGNYLRKPDNLFASLQSSSLWPDALRAMQEAGAIRQGVNPAVMAHIMDLLGQGLVTVHDFNHPDELPPFDDVMETIADLLDHYLTPQDGGNVEAGKAIIRQVAATSKSRLEHLNSPTKEDEGTPP